jgi:hypothetical protein
VGVSDGKVLGKLHSTYANPDAVLEIGEDLIALFSSGTTAGIQLFDYPDLNAGPAFVNGWDDEGDVPDGGLRDALVPFNGTEPKLSSDGRFLTIHGQGKNSSQTAVLSVPPWGRRLRELLVADASSTPAADGPSCTDACSSQIVKSKTQPPRDIFPLTVRTVPFVIDGNSRQTRSPD